MQSRKEIYELKGKVQHYAWGGHHFIPALLGIPNDRQKPFAEYWMGAHPGAPSVILSDHEEIPLNEIIEQDPKTWVNEKVYDAFGGLPFLFKVLDVYDMLSIQVHPTRAGAEKGFDAEELAGIPINASDRNYKDRNHKPEVMVALSEFWLLHGFKPQKELQQVLSGIPEFNFLLADFGTGDYYQLYKTVMELPQQQVDEILLPLARRVVKENNHTPNEPGYWVKKLFTNEAPLSNLDRGIFSIYFFNILQLQPGEAIYQGAGVPHAYLFGQNIELMANSDNVLRGGLTPKHIDVPELLKHTSFNAVEPAILKGTPMAGGEVHYPCPVEDFAISAIHLQPGVAYQSTSTSAEIFIVTEGAVETDDIGTSFKKGHSFLVIPGASYQLNSSSHATVFKAFVPA